MPKQQLHLLPILLLMLCPYLAKADSKGVFEFIEAMRETFIGFVILACALLAFALWKQGKKFKEDREKENKPDV